MSFLFRCKTFPARQLTAALGSAMLLAAASPASAQATSRHCSTEAGAEDRAGPACLLAHAAVGRLSADEAVWRLYTYPTLALAQQHQPANGVLSSAFGKIWLFTVGPASAARAELGELVAEVGPLPVNKETVYDAEFLKSTFSAGMSAPVHVHSGPEAFYALSGDTCLETPDGVQLGRGAGNSLVVRAGPPMLLMAVGTAPRTGFALILHDRALPPTTLVQHWKPKGLCTVDMR